MKSRIIQQGAEAVIKLVDGQVVKERVEKGYRFSELDNKLRLRRMRGEGKIINKLKGIVDVPEIFEVDENEKKIVMEFIDGKKLSDWLEKLDWVKVCGFIGEGVGKLHDAGIVHGDLTTSNMIWKDEKVYFIDFGLGFHSDKIEDKAVDLHLLKQALDAKHFEISEDGFVIILQEYRARGYKEIIQRIKIIESRGRYKKIV